MDSGSIFHFICYFSMNALVKIYQYLGDREEEITEFGKFYEDFKRKKDEVIAKLDKITD